MKTSLVADTLAAPAPIRGEFRQVRSELPAAGTACRMLPDFQHSAPMPVVLRKARLQPCRPPNPPVVISSYLGGEMGGLKSRA